MGIRENEHTILFSLALSYRNFWAWNIYRNFTRNVLANRKGGELNTIAWTSIGVLAGLLLAFLVVVYVITYFLFCLFHQYEEKGLTDYLKWVIGGFK